MRKLLILIAVSAPVAAVAQNPRSITDDFATALASVCEQSVEPQNRSKTRPQTVRRALKFMTRVGGVRDFCSCTGRRVALQIGEAQLTKRLADFESEGGQDFLQFTALLPVIELLEHSEAQCEVDLDLLEHQ